MSCAQEQAPPWSIRLYHKGLFSRYHGGAGVKPHCDTSLLPRVRGGLTLLVPWGSSPFAASKLAEATRRSDRSHLRPYTGICVIMGVPAEGTHPTAHQHTRLMALEAAEDKDEGHTAWRGNRKPVLHGR
jgi:hypothetical protein